MADIIEVNFRPEEEEDLILYCECGCSTFLLYSHGVYECAQCGSQESSEFVTETKNIPHRPDRNDEGAIKLTVTTSTEFAKIIALKKMNDRKAEYAAIIAFNNNGGWDGWDDTENEEHIDWLERQMKRYIDNLRTGRMDNAGK
jgi:hypothetical protein